jgi:endo-1,4-beta-D-glucanase Y
LAASLDEQDVLQEIWNLAEDNLTTEEIKRKSLLATDSYGNTTWHVATTIDEQDALQKI